MSGEPCEVNNADGMFGKDGIREVQPGVRPRVEVVREVLLEDVQRSLEQLVDLVLVPEAYARGYRVIGRVVWQEGAA